MSRKRQKRRQSSNSNQTTRVSLKETIRPKTAGQKEYFDAIKNNEIIMCSGPPGSGKTIIPVFLASIALLNKDFEKVIITRPTIEVGRSIGYLPGSADQKLYNYLIPLIENFKKFLGKEGYSFYKSQGKIEIVPIQLMRGRNFDNSFIICDEAENAYYDELKLLLTRIGMQSKMVLSGDFKQSDIDIKDRVSYKDNDFRKIFNKLQDLQRVCCVELGSADIVRNPIISDILAALGE